VPAPAAVRHRRPHRRVRDRGDRHVAQPFRLVVSRARDLLARVPVELRGRTPTNVHEYRRAAKRRLPKVIWDYVDGGAEDEQTVVENRAAFGRWALRPKILVDVSKTDL